MALVSTTVWECRANATAANVNGGGFNPSNATPGTDYSQQTAAQYNLSGCTTSGASAILLTASASADMCGNIGHLVSGTNSTTGLYEIVSVQVGVSLTLDRNCSTGSLASGAFNIGGAMSLQSSSGFTDSNFASALVAGNKVWIRGGVSNNTYALGATFNSANSGTATAAIVFEGYASSRGDKPTGSTRPQFSGAIFTFGNWTNLNYTIWKLNISSSLQPGINNICVGNKFTNTNQAAACVQPGNYFTAINCEFSCNKGSAFIHTNEHVLVGCYIHDSVTGVGNGNNGANFGSTYLNNIIENCTTAGISFTSAGTVNDLIEGNTFVGCNNTGIGVKLVAGSTDKIILNNIFTNLATGISVADSGQSLQGSMIYENWNNYFNNTTDVVNITKGAQDTAINPTFVNEIQLTGTGATVSGSTLAITSATGVVANQDFVNIISGTGVTAAMYSITNVSGNVLTLNVSPGGSGSNIVYQILTGHNLYPTQALNGKGNLGAFPGGLTAGFQNIGAVQTLPTLASTFVG